MATLRQKSSPRNCASVACLSASAVSTASLLSSAFKKKLYQYRPDRHAQRIQSFRTRKKDRREKVDPLSIERDVRQLLAQKISGDMMGLWLLAPEHLRWGTWELLTRWTHQPVEAVETRLALQLVHEAALCVTGVRAARSLNQTGFEVLNGLAFVASDQAVHELLAGHTVAEAETLQVELGLLRRARGHFRGDLLAIDPHRIRSFTQRQMCLYRGEEKVKPFRALQTFFCLDADTCQPVCFTSGSAALSVTQATPALLRLSAAILNPPPQHALVLADTEHYSTALVDHVVAQTPFDMLLPMPQGKRAIKELRLIPENDFIPRWAGFATTKRPYQIKKSLTGPQVQFIQRSGERPDAYAFKAFLSTRDDDEVENLTLHFPKRWHIEEFFHANQALGWQRAGTLNLNIRYGQMTMALLAQTAIHQLRQRLGEPYATWDAEHLARSIFNGIDGDIRVNHDTVTVTLYNAPHPDLLRQHYENLPEKLAAEHVDPRLPWLFNFKLDFRFR
jgi:hypothetical protein